VAGDPRALMDGLAPDIVLLSDGGGGVGGNLRPIITADRIAGWLAAVCPEFIPCLGRRRPLAWKAGRGASR